MECQRQCHLECAEDFYFQTLQKDGRLSFTAFTKAAHLRFKAGQVVNTNDARTGSTIAAAGTNNVLPPQPFSVSHAEILSKRRGVGR